MYRSEVKQYELQENRCKVGHIEVSTLAGTVTLDKAFEGTFITSVSMPPTPPVVMNIVEGKIGNNLIIVKPEVHILIHATKEDTIQRYMTLLNLNDEQVKRLNKLRLLVRNTSLHY